MSPWIFQHQLSNREFTLQYCIALCKGIVTSTYSTSNSILHAPCSFHTHVHTCDTCSLCSVVDKAWLMLKSYLETYDPLHSYKLQKCVVTKLLSLGSHIPQWLVKTYKVCTYIGI